MKRSIYILSFFLLSVTFVSAQGNADRSKMLTSHPWVVTKVAYKNPDKDTYAEKIIDQNSSCPEKATYIFNSSGKMNVEVNKEECSTDGFDFTWQLTNNNTTLNIHNNVADEDNNYTILEFTSSKLTIELIAQTPYGEVKQRLYYEAAPRNVKTK